jgi:hypothetical protein
LESRDLPAVKPVDSRSKDLKTVASRPRSLPAVKPDIE